MDRRRFLKITAVTGATAALAQCGNPENQIVRFIPEDEFTPGVAVWKPSICPLCAAGCGLNVRVMDADVDVVRNGQRGVVRAAVAKKLEGLPDHPVNRGALCARGQAAIQITYHPDRLRNPMKRTGARGSGEYREVTWDEALAELTSQLDALAQAGRSSSLVYLTKLRRSRRDEMVATFLDRFGAPSPMYVSLFDDAVLRRANEISFGRHQLPTIDLAQSRFVIAFGADFLGTWNSPVAQGMGYGAMRQGTRGMRGTFVQVEARMSQTGANADEWIPARPGTEGALALGLAHVILGERGTPGLADYSPAQVQTITGVDAARIEQLARAFAAASPAVAIIGGPALAHSNALEQALAVNTLNTIAGSVGKPGGIQFTPTEVTPRTDKTLATFASELLAGSASPVQVAIVDDANPVFVSPKGWRMREALERVPFIASFSSFLDETSILADLILPDHSFLESWVDGNPESGAPVAARTSAGPVMRPLYTTRATPDVLLEISQKLAKPLALPWKSYEEMLQGGQVGQVNPQPALPARPAQPAPTWSAPAFDGAPDAYPFHFLPYASTAFYDGSSAHLPWLQEMPDPMTSAMWSSWVEINPRTAERLQVDTGDLVEITSQHGSVQAPVVITPGIAPDIVAMPVGQGHESFTRYASGRGSNPIAVLAPVADAQTGALAWAATRVKITRGSAGASAGAGAGAGALIMFAGGSVEHSHEHR
jgi:anaerobic selenocysteine-containing dehydrogenase